MTNEQLSKAISKKIQEHKDQETFWDKYFLNWWIWSDGRRTDIGGYKKMTLLSYGRWWLGLIRYRKGEFQPVHVDPLLKKSKGHLKINIELITAPGSSFLTMYPHFQLGRLHIFWAHHNPHQVTAPTQGTRYVLSFSYWPKTWKRPNTTEWLKEVIQHQLKTVHENPELLEQTHWKKALKDFTMECD